MATAPVGDDVYGDDPTVRLLEERTAALLGKENAVYMVSGTMTNQVAIRAHTEPGDAVLFDQNAHVYVLEGGAPASLSGVLPPLLPGVRGIFSPQILSLCLGCHIHSSGPLDTVSVCFSKALGAPIGSCLAGPKAFVDRARRFKQQFGGGFRQAGLIAAGALYALDHHRSRLGETHEHASTFARNIASFSEIDIEPATVETNIVRF